MKNLFRVSFFSVFLIFIAPSTYADLITNGSFDGWTGWGHGGTVYVHGGITHFNEHDYYPNGYVYQDIDTVVGREYRLELDYTSHGGWAPYGAQRVELSVGTSPVVLNAALTDTSISYDWKTVSYDFIAQQTTTRVFFRDRSSYYYSRKCDFHIDNISVEPDSDGDGVFDPDDLCPGTAAESTVDVNGCSGVQLVADECPVTETYKNHGKYVSCVSNASEDAVDAGLLTQEEKDAIVSTGAKSRIGKKSK